MKKYFFYGLLKFSFLLLVLLLPTFAAADCSVEKGKKVLVVMSYHPGFTSEDQMKDGINETLPCAEIKYFYLNTKYDLPGGKKKAAEAFSLFQSFQPDAVIAADDNAQSFFVVPYLKEKVDTPVIFCGVNEALQLYGYPAKNISGVQEKKHYREAISFAQVLVPSIKRVGIIYRKTPSNKANIDQINREKKTYHAEIAEMIEVSTKREAEDSVRLLESRVDAILILNLTGIRDDKNRGLDGKDILTDLVRLTSKPTIGTMDWGIEAGALCGVIYGNKEQGLLAAEMLQEVWQGKDIHDIPVTWNRNGERQINLTTLKKLGIKLAPEAVLGSKIITSEIMDAR